MEITTFSQMMTLQYLLHWQDIFDGYEIDFGTKSSFFFQLKITLSDI